MIRGRTKCAKKDTNAVLPHLAQSIAEKLEANHILMDLHYNFKIFYFNF